MAAIDISTLTVEQRLELLDEIWESLYETPQAIPLTGAQRQELDRRLDEVDRDGPDGIPWDEVLRRLRSKSE
jgi:putative addiction module component (TIGR02574 family)